MLNRRLPTDTRGDTIIEVMLVLAVLGLAISISYATANRSLINARQAQESSVATALIQSQLEAVRTLAPLNPAPPAPPDLDVYKSAPATYCIKTDVNNYVVVPTSDPACNPAINDDPASGSYSLSITYSAAPTDTFTAKATWPDVRDQGNDSATLVYRAHKAL
jgi:prepilin-type N-terminal cleavage/methylation domain-containing protein